MSSFSTADGAAQLVEAVKLFLDTASSTQIDSLLDRLRPYRTETRQFWTAEGTIEYKDTLVIEGLMDFGGSQPFGFSALLDSGSTAKESTESSASQYASTQGAQLPDPSSSTNYALGVVAPEHGLDVADSLSLGGFQGLLCDSVSSQGTFAEDVFDTAVDAVTAVTADNNIGMAHFSQSTLSGTLPYWLNSSGDSAQPPANSTDATLTEDLVGVKKRNAGESRGLQLSFVNCIREDVVPFLIQNVGQWSEEGLWHEELPSDQLATPSEGGLVHVYSCICRFDSRKEKDTIRSRAAMVILHAKYDALVTEKPPEQQLCIEGARRGRGYASVMVDRLLRSIHPGWETANKEQKAELRAKFHERKRYGKRWSVLASQLGYGILFLASSKLAAAV
ncbi:hypothetical protein LLEC1_02918 [Akanthomyces lecanii]|uniref:Uncharacterized protein n=1 Tax=Cordyceps confragosa TaxID=2714763 RepID=A0A179IJD2_CORDF|nr:hypothetical protein LLEC1_02918 [Akanthomyces lecanii]